LIEKCYNMIAKQCKIGTIKASIFILELFGDVPRDKVLAFIV